MITTVAAQINLVVLGSGLFSRFYAPTHHSINARYLFFGWASTTRWCHGSGRRSGRTCWPRRG